MTDISQKVPDQIEELWASGILVGGMARFDKWDLAQGFRSAGDALASTDHSDRAPIGHAMLFNYRHSLELLLKQVLSSDSTDHALLPLLQELERYTLTAHCAALPRPFIDELSLQYAPFCCTFG